MSKLRELFDIGIKAKKRQAENFRDQPDIHKILTQLIAEYEIEMTDYEKQQKDIEQIAKKKGA